VRVTPSQDDPFPGNNSATADIVRTLDWSSTPVGPIDSWPQSLRTAVGLVLDAKVIKVMMWGPELTTFYNDAYAEFLGPDTGHGIGRSYPKFRPHVWQAIKAYVEPALAGHGQSVSQMRGVTRRSGEEDFGHFSISYVPVRDESGAVAGVMCELIEVTAQVQLQALLQEENRRHRELFDQAPVFMSLFGGAPDYELRYMNRAFRELVGDRDILGIPIIKALPGVAPQGFLALLDRAHDAREPMIGWDVPWKLEDNEGRLERLYYLDFIYQPIIGTEGLVTGILCVGSDVTERHIAREQAEKLQRDLHHVSRVSAMGTMAATIAHELSQPLTAAGNYLAGAERTSELREEGDREALRSALERARAQIDRAGEIIRRARDTAMSDRAPHEAVGLSVLVQRALELIEVTGSCGEVQIRTDLDPQADMVCVDPVQVEQVLLNLIRNACQAMARCRRRELLISTRPREDGFAEVCVADTGPGLDPGGGDVFAAFVRSTTGGLGIGLSLSRTLVESHGGSMWAHNNPDGGATFRFTLPMHDSAARVAPELET